MKPLNTLATIRRYFSFRTRLDLLLMLFGIGALYLSSLYNNLLFHSLTEVIGAILAVAVFATIWNARRYLDNNYFLLIGIALLFVSGFDLLNSFSYEGMNVFPGYDIDLSILFWVGANFMLSISFLVAPFFIHKKLRSNLTLLVYAFVFTVFLLSIFWWHLFPQTTTEAMHLTSFNNTIEIFIAFVLACGCIALIQNRKRFDPDVWKVLSLAIILFMLSGFFVTRYALSFDLHDKIGHLLKVVAFYVMYIAIARVAVVKPSRLLFKNLQDSQEEMIASYERLEYAQRAAKTGFWNWDMITGKLTWSRELYNIFGLPSYYKASFETWREIMHPDDQAKAEDKINYSVEKHIPLESEYRITHPDGQVHWISALGNTTYTEEGKPERMSGICIDITSRKKDEETLHRQADLLNLSHEAIFTWSLDGGIIFWNQGAQEIYGYSSQEALGQISHKLLKTIHPIELKEIIKQLSIKKIWNGELIHTTKDGKKITVETRHQLVEDDSGHPIVLEITHDVTKRKRNEDRIEKLTQLYAVLSKANEAIVRIKDIPSLYREICQIICADTHYPLVWISQVKGNQVRPVAWSGPAADYLKEIKIEVTGKFGAGPTGTSIRENRPIINDDFHDNPLTTPWRKQALTYGFRASASFPLHQQEIVVGTLTLYALESNAFDTEQVELLKSLCSDISFALTAIDEEQKRKQIEEKIKSYAKQLEIGKAEDEALLSNIADAIVAIDLSGTITFTNRAFQEITGQAEEELQGKFDQLVVVCNKEGEILPMEQRPIGEAIRTGKKVISGTAVTSELYLARRDGKKIPLLITAAPIALNGQITGAIAVWHDITREKEIDQAKNEFVSLASHQLRTPLASISLSSELLLRGVAGGVDEKQKRYLEEIYSSTKRMSQLITTLLDVSRIELGTFRVKPGPTDITRSIDHVVQDLMPQINDKKLILQRNYEAALPIIEYDQNVLRIIMENLIGNALRYTPPQGKITININKRDSYIIISVADTGYGIPEHQQKHIFDKSFRADNAKEIQVDGTGLGLYITKSVADRMNTQIRFESKLNKGTTFYVSIPLPLNIKTSGS